MVPQFPLSGAGKEEAQKWVSERKALVASAASAFRANKDLERIREYFDQTKANFDAKAEGVAAGVREVEDLRPQSYGDSAYWEKRHAKGRRDGETYEWYTEYPAEALQEVLFFFTFLR